MPIFRPFVPSIVYILCFFMSYILFYGCSLPIIAFLWFIFVLCPMFISHGIFSVHFPWFILLVHCALFISYSIFSVNFPWFIFCLFIASCLFSAYSFLIVYLLYIPFTTYFNCRTHKFILGCENILPHQSKHLSGLAVQDPHVSSDHSRPLWHVGYSGSPGFWAAEGFRWCWKPPGMLQLVWNMQVSNLNVIIF